MNQKRLDERRFGGQTRESKGGSISLALVTFALVFAAGFLITNWLAFVPQ